MPKSQRPTRAFAWAWALPGRNGLQLCNWAEPTKETLERESAEHDYKPSPDAVMVKVVLIPAVEFNELIRRDKAISERERRCAAIEYNATRSASSESENPTGE